MTDEQGDMLQGNELEEIRGDIRVIVSKLDRIIADRNATNVEMEIRQGS